MNRNQLNRTERYDKSRVAAEEYKDLWSADPAAVLAVAELDIEISHLKATQRAQVDRSKPATRKKREGRKTMKATVLWLAAVLLTYADEQGDEALKEIAELIPAKLGSLSDSKFASVGMDLIEQAEKIGPSALEPYGIDEDKMVDLRTTMEAIVALFPMQQFTIAQLAAMQKMVPVRLDRARYIIYRKLRNLFYPFKESHPDFWETFEASLRVIDKRGRKKNVTGSNPDTNQDQDQNKA